MRRGYLGNEMAYANPNIVESHEPTERGEAAHVRTGIPSPERYAKTGS